MKAVITLAAALALSTASVSAFANAQLAKDKNCTACHAVGTKLIGPSFKDIAAKYKDDKAAKARLAKKVREGGTGVWGQVPMPANPQVNADESDKLVAWILDGAK